MLNDETRKKSIKKTKKILHESTQVNLLNSQVSHETGITQ